MEIMTIGDCIKKLRENQKLSQEQLGVKASLSGATINRVEKGHNVPSKGTLKLIAQALGVKLEDIQK